MVAHLPPPGPWSPPTVGVAPNTCMAAALSLRRAAERYRRDGDEGEADACEEIAQRLSRSMVRGGWPDPLDPWPAPE